MADNISDKLNILLASGSPRRREILESHGLHPVVMPMDVDESLPDRIAPHDAVMYLALKKGLACEQALLSGNYPDQDTSSCSDTKEHALIVSSDTIVYARDIITGEWTIMGKPKDDNDAWRMLKSIVSGRHKVMSGVAVIGAGSGAPSIRRVFYDSTDVYVKPMTDDEIREYIDSGEPFGKAGGYAIQLGFGKNIDHIEGDFENVVGFPFEHFRKELLSEGLIL